MSYRTSKKMSIPKLKKLRKEDFEVNKCFCRPKKEFGTQKNAIRLGFKILKDALTSKQLLSK